MAEEVATGIGLNLALDYPRLTEEERSCIKQGLQLVSREIQTSAPDLPLVVQIQKVEFNPCDYQSDGLVCALAGWAAQHFGFPMPEIPVFFHRERKRYVYAFPPEV